MNVHFLGYTGSIQHAGSANVSLVVEESREVVLVDVSGAPVMEMLKAGIDPRDLKTVLITHSHIDHIYALPSLIHQLWLMGRAEPLVIVGNRETIGKARELCSLFGLEQKNRMFPLVWKILENGVYGSLAGQLRLTVFPVPHGVPTVGCVFESAHGKVAYFADCTADVAYPEVAYDADLLIHEAGGLCEDSAILAGKGHSSSRQAAEAARMLRAGRLVLCHLPSEVSMYQLMLAEAQAVFKRTELPVLYKAYGCEKV